MGIGTTSNDQLTPQGVVISEVQAAGGTMTYPSVDAVHAARLQVTQGNNLPPVWQGDTTTGRMAPDIAGGIHFQKILLVTAGQPALMDQQSQDQE